MDSLESESGTVRVFSFLDEFFSRIPTDSRFNKIEIIKVLPQSMIVQNTKQIDFALEKKLPPYCYLLGRFQLII